MSETPWLSTDEQVVWRSYLEGTQRLWDVLTRELDERSTLPLSEYEVLVRLNDTAAGSLRMSELADLLVHSRSRLTHTVARMERRDLVVRERHLTDGRGVVARITTAGREALEAAAPVHVTGVRRHLFDQMDPDEVEVVGRVLARLVGHLRETGADRPSAPDARAAGERGPVPTQGRVDDAPRPRATLGA